MKVLIVNNTKIPALKYGGTERDIWGEGKELVKMGHQVTYLVAKGSSCPFAKILIYNPLQELDLQIPDKTDVVHIHFPLREPLRAKPYLVSVHGNGKPNEQFDRNTIFVSKNHAERHGSKEFVYNGLDLELPDYGEVSFREKREHLLFLARTSRKEKNLKGCIELAKIRNEKLAVLGGHGFSFDSRISYKGIVGGAKKKGFLNKSKALLFPVLWYEPMGLAIIESLYFGAPVFGTRYGSLPELVSSDFGFLSNSKSDLAEALKHIGSYDARKCHEYVADNFTARHMTENYLKYFEKVLNGEILNPTKPQAGSEIIPQVLAWLP